MSNRVNRVKHSNSFFEDQSVASMHFWGICCESGKRYAQVVGQRFRMTMAVLDPKSFCKEDKIVSLVVIRDGIEYLLCVLKHGELHQVNLNLIFDTGENVIFYINGYGRVYLSGYQLTDSIAEVLADENGYLCPLVELKSKGKKEIVKNVEPEASTSRNKKLKKALLEDGDPDLWRKEIASQGDENGDEDEEDSDFSASDLPESESEEIESEEMDDDLSDVVSDEIDEDDLDEDERELIMASQKRKRRTALLAQKRARKESMNCSDYAENEDIIYVEDKDPEASMGSPGVKANNEPASSEKKKKKKKKKLTEISHIAESTEANEEKSPTKKKAKMPVQKLEGGLEIQDVQIGNGPVASKGKVIHVFYVGRFEDKTIFDARTPGKKPFSFKLGAGQVIKGWDIGLQGMKVGGQRKLKVPPNMAYGNSHNSGVPPNSTLYFTVELQNVS